MKELLVWKFSVLEYCDNVGLSNQNDMARYAVSLFTGKAKLWWMDWSRSIAGDL